MKEVLTNKQSRRIKIIQSIGSIASVVGFFMILGAIGAIENGTEVPATWYIGASGTLLLAFGIAIYKLVEWAVKSTETDHDK